MNTEAPHQCCADSYRDLYENAPVAYHELDAQGTILSVNAAECALLGYTAEEMIGQPVWDFIAGGEIDDARLELLRRISGHQPLVPFQRQYVTRDRRYITVEIRNRLIRDDSGRGVGIRSVLIDVTARVEAEAALRESAMWLKTVLHSLGEAIVAIDALGLVKFQNPAAEVVTGWPAREAVGRDIDEVVLLHCGDAGAVGELVSIGGRSAAIVAGGWRYSGVVRSRSGAVTEVSLLTFPISPDNQDVVGMAITMRKRCPNNNEHLCLPASGWSPC